MMAKKKVQTAGSKRTAGRSERKTAAFARPGRDVVCFAQVEFDEQDILRRFRQLNRKKRAAFHLLLMEWTGNIQAATP